jgi:hypothetical protein
VVGVGSGIAAAEWGGVAEGAGVAVGIGVAVGVGIGVAVGVGVAEGVGIGVAVGIWVAEGVGIGVAVGVGVTEGVGVAGLQAKSNEPMENKSGPNSSLFILCEWVVMRHLACHAFSPLRIGATDEASVDSIGLRVDPRLEPPRRADLDMA